MQSSFILVWHPLCMPFHAQEVAHTGYHHTALCSICPPVPFHHQRPSTLMMYSFSQWFNVKEEQHCFNACVIMEGGFPSPPFGNVTPLLLTLLSIFLSIPTAVIHYPFHCPSPLSPAEPDDSFFSAEHAFRHKLPTLPSLPQGPPPLPPPPFKSTSHGKLHGCKPSHVVLFSQCKLLLCTVPLFFRISLLQLPLHQSFQVTWVTPSVCRYGVLLFLCWIHLKHQFQCFN